MAKGIGQTQEPMKIEKPYYTWREVMDLLGVKEGKAREVTKELNDELAEKGYHPYPPGKVSKKYFHERFY
jgi:hypothetical protein